MCPVTVQSRVGQRETLPLRCFCSLRRRKDRSIEYRKPPLVAQTVDYPVPNPNATPPIKPPQLVAGLTVDWILLIPFLSAYPPKSGQPSTSVGPGLCQG